MKGDLQARLTAFIIFVGGPLLPLLVWGIAMLVNKMLTPWWRRSDAAQVTAGGLWAAIQVLYAFGGAPAAFTGMYAALVVRPRVPNRFTMMCVIVGTIASAGFFLLFLVVMKSLQGIALVILPSSIGAVSAWLCAEVVRAIVGERRDIAAEQG